jgi:arginyl-tRNA synthetase
MFREDIKLTLQKVLDELQIKEVKIELEHPAELTHGDYSTNIALVSAKLLKKNPRQLAEEIAKMWEKTGLPASVEKIEVAGAGFINIWLNSQTLSKEIDRVITLGKQYGQGESRKGQTFLLEHTSPNTNKSLHVGHVRNNVTGMAIARILQFAGAKVILDCLFNDRGIHICKAMWAYLKKDRMGEPWREVLEDWFNNQGEWPSPKSENLKPDKFVEEYYSLGVRVEDEGENRREMEEMLIAWEAKDPLVRTLWKTLNDWFYEGVSQSFERLGSHHDHYWYESQFYEQAKELVAEGLSKGVFRKLADGAVLTDLEKEGLSDTIVQRADGTSMYFTQDIYLTKQKTEKFLADKYIWLVGPEQQLHLKQVFTVAEQLGISRREKFLHLWYGYVFLKGKGKMSSRAGTVVTADSLMDEARDYALKLIQGGVGVGQLASGEDKVIAEAVGLGAIKYALLKLTRTQDINFDWEESISLKGNSGPYLQYTYARTQSILRKSEEKEAGSTNLTGFDVSAEEQVLLRTVYRFPEVTAEAAEEFAPNAICNYLFDLSQKFNLFYDKHRIIGSDKEYFRLQLTKAVGQILQNGLELLGIEALERM